MHQKTIDELLRTFQITSQDIHEIKALKENIHSLTTTVINEFFTNYIATNDSLLPLVSKIDVNVLKHKIELFFIALFSADFDNEYLNRIKEVGKIHFRLGIDPSKVSFGFMSLHSIIHTLSLVNPTVKHLLTHINKVLKLVEYVMNDSYYQMSNDNQKTSSSEYQAMATLDELFSAMSLHRINYQKIVHFHNAKFRDIQQIKSIHDDYNLCAVGKLINALKKKSTLIEILNLDINLFYDIHQHWHQNFVAYKTAFHNNETTQMQRYFDAITHNKEEMVSLIEDRKSVV